MNHTDVVATGDGGYCDPGNHCYNYPGYSRDVCCTNSACTAVAIGGSVSTIQTPAVAPTGTEPAPTVYAAPSAASTTTNAPATITQPPRVTYDYYTYTFTWWYYYYYWTYYVEEPGSVVTSSETTVYETTTFSASDETEASSIAASISQGFSTPAAATSLASIAGSTKGMQCVSSILSLARLPWSRLCPGGQRASRFQNEGGPATNNRFNEHVLPPVSMRDMLTTTGGATATDTSFTTPTFSEPSFSTPTETAATGASGGGQTSGAARSTFPPPMAALVFAVVLLCI